MTTLYLFSDERRLGLGWERRSRGLGGDGGGGDDTEPSQIPPESLSALSLDLICKN